MGYRPHIAPFSPCWGVVCTPWGVVVCIIESVMWAGVGELWSWTSDHWHYGTSKPCRHRSPHACCIQPTCAWHQGHVGVEFSNTENACKAWWRLKRGRSGWLWGHPSSLISCSFKAGKLDWIKDQSFQCKLQSFRSLLCYQAWHWTYTVFYITFTVSKLLPWGPTTSMLGSVHFLRRDGVD